jgi:hypothetical protein
MFKKKLFAIVFLVAAVLFLNSSALFADELGDIQKAIKEKGAKWVAGKTSMMMLSPEERRMRLGLGQAKGTPDTEAAPYQESFAAVPANFDWRDVDGNGTSYVTPVRNQRSCGSCWAFAAAAGLESYTIMTQNAPNTNIDVAEQILISCYNTNGCSGGSPSGASSYIKTKGLPPESCSPYTAFDAEDGDNSVPCNTACLNETYKILNYGSVSFSVAAIKDALVNYGPLVTTFNVYGDFYGYSGGIYSYTSGAYQGGHAVLIVGYDDVNSCFIVKNSWGTGWGEAGFFRIAYSQLASPIYFGSGTLTYYGSLAAPSITITTPSGTTSWQAGTSQLISWTFTGYPGSSIKIDLLKAGTFNRTIANSASISSSYNWMIPADLAPGSDYQIEVTSTSNSSITDTSDTFSITAPPPPFSSGGKVTTGDLLTGIPGVTMTFSRVSGTGTVPAAVITLVDGIWSQTGFQSGTTYKVTPSLSGYGFNPASSDFSAESTGLNFTGTPPIPPGITLSFPNAAGLRFKTGSTVNISWNYTGSPGTYVKVELLKGGQPVSTITTKAKTSNKSYNWRINRNQSEGTDYKIRITSTTNAGVADTSDNNFEIYK